MNDESIKHGSRTSSDEAKTKLERRKMKPNRDGIPTDDGYRGDFNIITELRDGEKNATGNNTRVYMDGKEIQHLAAVHLRVVGGGGPVTMMLEIIPNSLDIELKNAKGVACFAYEQNKIWHDIRGVIDERNKRLDRPTGSYDQPKIACLCGSVRFADLFAEADEYLTSQGFMVLQPGVWGKHKYFHSDDTDTEAQEYKKELDELHFRKIEISDVVYIINKDGYIGESTRSEIEHAKAMKKPVVYMFDEKTGKRNEWK